MYHNVFRYEYLTFQIQIHLPKQYYFDMNIIQSEYAFLFSFQYTYIVFGLSSLDNRQIFYYVETIRPSRFSVSFYRGHYRAFGC